MRIVLVISSLGHGGAETQVIALSRELVRRGHDVAIYTLNRENPRQHELEGSGVELVVDQKRVKLDPAVLLRLRRFLRAFRADIVHGFLYDGDLYSRVAAAGTGIPALNSERSDRYHLKLQQRVGLWLTRSLADCVVANSHTGARFAAGLFGLPQGRVVVVWNGIDVGAVDARVRACRHDYKSEYFGDPSIRLACLAGRVDPSKDMLLALAVADRLTRDHSAWRVLLVGPLHNEDAEYTARVLAAFRERDLDGRVVMAGLRSDVLEIMSQCDVVFSTSRREGFPNVVLEAMTVGTPVVSTEYSDIARILPQPWQVVAGRTPENLVAAILRACRERAVLGPAQRDWVDAHATIQVAAATLEQVYRRFHDARH